MSELTLTNGQQLSVACGDGHVVTVKKLDAQRLSIKVERVESDWTMWQWLLCVYLSIVITLVLADMTGNTPALKSVWDDITRGWKEPALKGTWADVTGVTPVLKKAFANLSQAFKK